MAASLMNLLDDLETRLERTQAELEALRNENLQLKQQLARQDTPAQNVPGTTAMPNPEASSSPEAMPSTETTPTAARPSEEAASPIALVEETPSQEAASETTDLSPAAPVDESTKTPSPHALLNQWYERYPKAFFKGHTKPLKVGIHQDLAEREEWPNKLIRRALANYVNLPRYIKAVRVGAERVDLDGQPAGKVDKEAAQHASEKRGDKKERGGNNKEGKENKEERAQPKKAQSTSPPAIKKPQKEAKPAPEAEKNEKSEPRKPLSMEDKLLGLQQKFKGR